MRKIFQIAFCVLSCLCLAVAVPLLVLYRLWGLIPVGGALVFGILMFLVKDGLFFFKSSRREKPDFMNSDEENERIRRELAETDQTQPKN